MADNAETPVPADVVEAKTPPPSADSPRVEDVISRVSGPLAIMGATIKSISRYDHALTALERIAFSRVSKAQRSGQPLTEEVIKPLHEQVEKLWLASYEASIVCIMAANDVASVVDALKPEIERQMKIVDRTFIYAGVKTAVICHLLDRPAPEALQDADFEDGSKLAQHHNKDFDAVSDLLKRMTDEQRYRLDIYKLVRAVMVHSAEPVNIESCLLTDEELAAAEADVAEQQAGEQAAQEAQNTQGPPQDEAVEKPF